MNIQELGKRIVLDGTINTRSLGGYETKDGRISVKVGSVEHPMTEEHFIEWIAIQTKFGNQRKCLKPGMKPEACFLICEDDEVEAVYAYCNLHSLWKA